MEKDPPLDKIEVVIVETMNLRIHTQRNTPNFYTSWDDIMLNN